jgi:hypothetical protein
MVDMEAEENDDEADIDMYGRVLQHKIRNNESEGEDEDDQDNAMLEGLIDTTLTNSGESCKVVWLMPVPTTLVHCNTWPLF